MVRVMLPRTLLALLTVALLAAVPVASLPTPGLNGSTTEMIPVVGRLFPEPLQTNDYIGYFEAVASLEKLNTDYPDRVELFKVGKSYGWLNDQDQREPNDVLLIEVTNEKSTVPMDQKIQLFFMCSIHGNEKGGREGCLRVIEDFAKGIGVATSDQVALLDYMLLIFNIPNTDGWTHDEPEYLANNPPTVGPMYTRSNANGTDLNRNWPSMGFMEQDKSHRTLAEPESAAVANFVQDRYQNVWYASDIHGMLNPADLKGPPNMPQDCSPTTPMGCESYPTEFTEWLSSQDKGHFLLSLLPAGQLTQAEQIRMTRLSELIRERTEDCAGGPLAPAWCAPPVDAGVWGGDFNHWGTVWETINYQVSGGSHDWMLSDHGLNAPSVSFEMSYNHIVCDGVYPGCGETMNDFHVNLVRRIVVTFMEAAKTDFQVSIDSHGKHTAYLYNPLVVSNVDEAGNRRPSGGWADENQQDNRWDVLNNDFYASPNDYLRDMAKYVVDGETRGVFDEVPAIEITKERLDLYDNFIVAGSAAKQLKPEHKEIVKAWVEAGGNLILTDAALELAAELGAVSEGSVQPIQQYVGYTEVLDYTHPIAKDLIGFSRQTYEPVPIGYQQGASPIWVISTSSVREKGTVVGVVAPGNQRLDEAQNTNLGELKLGSGTVRFLGALVPDPTYELYTPYGVASYAVTYAGNQFFINLLGFDLLFKAPPLVLDDTGSLKKANSDAPTGPRGDNGTAAAGGMGADSPAPGLALAGLALLCAVAAMRRRRDA